MLMSLLTHFKNELLKNFSGEIREDVASKVLYSTDASIYQMEPLGVALPRTQEDLIAVVELAAKYHIPVLPRGSGSSLAGQAIGRALIVDCSRYLNNIIGSINLEEKTVTVEPGVILADLNRVAARHGLMFGPDPASAERATMGGVIGNNATGAHSLLYGLSVDHLESANVILSDGSLAEWGRVDENSSSVNIRQDEIIKKTLDIRKNYESVIKEKWPKAWRNSAGYRLNYLLPWSASQPSHWFESSYPPLSTTSSFNLASLLAGSEGTLAVIRSATVRLVQKPKNTILGVLAYESIAEACDAVPALLKHDPSAIELVPQMLIRLARGVPSYAAEFGFVRGDPAALLVIEFSGDDKDRLRKRVFELGDDVVVADSIEEQSRVWGVRKVGLGIFDSRPKSSRPVAFIEDCAIPVERLGEFVREVEKILLAQGAEAAFYAHASAGCLHIRPIIDLKTARGVIQLRSIAQEVLALTVRLGGAMSSEHGDGLARAEWLEETYGAELIGVMKDIKEVADPDHIFNPEKFYDAPLMDANLRYGAGYIAQPWKPALLFSHEAGLSGAIEQCNGQGVCRKADGVMCPSFQVTREEMHSTRGRANLLRALITHSHAGLKNEQVKEALDLCLACKGCKAECPSGVDMAKLKYEFQSHYYKSHPRLMRDYLFGYIGVIAKYVAPFGGVLNALFASKNFKKLANRFAGISENRTFPSIAYVQQKGAHQIKKQNNHEICLFLPDTFTHYFEPEIEQAAFMLLSACGVAIKVLPVFGAGRTLLSKGFIEPAKKHLTKLLDEIKKADPEGRLPIVGLEPSEIYTLRDEISVLLPERQKEVDGIIARAWLLDEYLIRPGMGKNTPRIKNCNFIENGATHEKVILHGHCYQKAQLPHADGMAIGVNASVELLKFADFDVEVIQSGCCGMAGAFGYEKEHYDISMRVGELKLFPEIRSRIRQQSFVVAAVGTSCRTQIYDGTGVDALHSVMIVSKKLKVE